MHRPFRQIALVLPLWLAACVNPTSSPPIPAEVPIESTTFVSSLGVNLAGSTKINGMYVRDIVVGTGPMVTVGQTLAMHYSGYLANGTLFDSNTGASPFTFQLGRGQVIGGWDVGIQGMHVGGQRQLIIPPALGYGTTPITGIPANSVLVFNVEVVSAQ
jgi:FKBP-type peptidyl-prolyl cis-trans isomerase FkpA